MANSKGVDSFLSGLSQEELEYALRQIRPLLVEVKVENFLRGLSPDELQYTLGKANAILGKGPPPVMKGTEGVAVRSVGHKRPPPSCWSSLVKMLHHGCGSNGPVGVKGQAKRAAMGR